MSALHLTPEQYAQHQARVRGSAATCARDLAPAKPQPSKMRSKAVVINGERFDSQKEYQRWLVLKDMEKRGEIRFLARQVRYGFEINGVHICDYVADAFFVKDGVEVVEDVKPTYKSERSEKRYKGTDAYRRFLIKKRLMLALFGITVEEV